MRARVVVAKRAFALAVALEREQTDSIEIGRQALAARVEHAVCGKDGSGIRCTAIPLSFPTSLAGNAIWFPPKSTPLDSPDQIWKQLMKRRDGLRGMVGATA
jgi:hypothetical protein